MPLDRIAGLDDDQGGDHRLKFRFTEDSVGEFDFAALVNELGLMVEPLRDVAYFKCVVLEFGAPTWPKRLRCCAELAAPRNDRVRHADAHCGGSERLQGWWGLSGK
jgi:hypothetical protein